MINKVKIIATIGPKTANKVFLKKLEKAGMSIARLNGSHNTLLWHDTTIRLIQDVLPNIPILFDIPGKKIRTIQLKHEPKFNKGDKIVLTTDQSFDGSIKVPVNNLNLHLSLSKNDIILADDGTLKFTVINVQNKDIICKAQSSGQLKSAKGINVPYVNIKGPLITERDRKLISFCKRNKVDFIGISFVESAEHVEKIRKLIKGQSPRIVAKVENSNGLKNVDEIAQATDVIMIDRGDLSTETDLENLAIYQKEIIKSGSAYSKPVIVATEMLHTMIENPIPTKAEVMDISNAVIDGASATMLSGETAIGKYPIESIKIMKKVSDSIIFNINKGSDKTIDIPEAIGKSIVQLCNMLPITKIITLTISGYAARMISSEFPRQPILAVSNDKMAARSFNILQGTKGIHVDVKFRKDSLEHVMECLEILWKRKEIKKSDCILITSLAYPNKGRRMNNIQTYYVSDLIKNLKWK